MKRYTRISFTSCHCKYLSNLICLLTLMIFMSVILCSIISDSLSASNFRTSNASIITNPTTTIVPTKKLIVPHIFQFGVFKNKKNALAELDFLKLRKITAQIAYDSHKKIYYVFKKAPTEKNLLCNQKNNFKKAGVLYFFK